MKRSDVLLFTAAFCLFVFPSRAHAYLDPASGSMLIQIAVGSVLSLAAIVKLYWRKIKSLFRRGPVEQSARD